MCNVRTLVKRPCRNAYVCKGLQETYRDRYAGMRPFSSCAWAGGCVGGGGDSAVLSARTAALCCESAAARKRATLTPAVASISSSEATARAACKYAAPYAACKIRATTSSSERAASVHCLAARTRASARASLVRAAAAPPRAPTMHAISTAVNATAAAIHAVRVCESIRRSPDVCLFEGCADADYTQSQLTPPRRSRP
jgi:hypothetical protein